MSKTCGYCLGTGSVIEPIDPNKDEQELVDADFIPFKCPVCSGTGVTLSEDTSADEYEEEDFYEDFDES